MFLLNVQLKVPNQIMSPALVIFLLQFNQLPPVYVTDWQVLPHPATLEYLHILAASNCPPGYPMSGSAHSILTFPILSVLGVHVAVFAPQLPATHNLSPLQ